ncbi:hypothetical protein MKW98_024900 [Papaver atlanticum]|uniref:Uncharacterized protein n=1 Tax=Papaver atlanticum TaxID=357466 RepID=A0AAD4XSK2_9MAGN|nr:hypothetical protein MKW98_024900 [Papaver atlanticum]
MFDYKNLKRAYPPKFSKKFLNHTLSRILLVDEILGKHPSQSGNQHFYGWKRSKEGVEKRDLQDCFLSNMCKGSKTQVGDPAKDWIFLFSLYSCVI